MVYLFLEWVIAMTEKQKTVNDLLKNIITMYIKPELPQKLIDIFSQDGYDEPLENNYKPPINQFIESANELGLNLSNDLTEKIVNEAYLNCVAIYHKYLQDKIEPDFKISVKETAWEYLIKSLRFTKNKK